MRSILLPCLVAHLLVSLSSTPAGADVVLLRSGEVLSGQVTAAGDRYYVTGPGRQIQVPSRDVLLTARDLNDAFEKQRAALRPTDLDGYQQLARWCLRHDLVREAALAIDHLAARDPLGAATLQLQQRLAARQQRPAPADSDIEVRETVVKRQVASKTRRGPATARIDAEDPADVPPSAVEVFTTKIQPLLLNRCGTTGCHAAGSSAKWQLARLDSGAVLSRRTTLRNLRETLAIVDRQQPHNSPLLTAPRTAHGTAPTALFNGRSQAQYELLSAWVESLQTGGDKAGCPAPRLSTGKSVAAQAPSWTPGAAAIDPFDPAPFNRRFAAPVPTANDSPRAADERR